MSSTVSQKLSTRPLSEEHDKEVAVLELQAGRISIVWRERLLHLVIHDGLTRSFRTVSMARRAEPKWVDSTTEERLSLTVGQRGEGNSPSFSEEQDDEEAVHKLQGSPRFTLCR